MPQTAPAIMPSDLEDPKTYEVHRREALKAMKRYKDERRVALADDISLLFEDRRTIQHQIQEMVRMEGDDPDAVDAVFRHYTDLMPNGNDLIATLFVEVREHTQIKPRLRHYAGLERALRLEVDGQHIQPEFQGDTGNDQAATAVTYLRFPIPQGLRNALDAAKIVLDHPNVQVRVGLPPVARRIPT